MMLISRNANAVIEVLADDGEVLPSLTALGQL